MIKQAIFNVKQLAEKYCIFSTFPLLLYINHNSALPSLCEASHKDGWGEGFEQREINIDRDAELYVHLWNSDDWNILTEEECFTPKLASGLPEMCFTILKTTGELICIKCGESGYYTSDWSTHDKGRNEELANELNEQLGVTVEQRKAMEAGSMFGWGCPAADPKSYEQAEQQIGGMTLG